MRASAKAWMGIAAYVILWDLACEPDEMLSDASLRFAKNHPVAAYAVVGCVAAHLVGRIPQKVDVIHLFGAGLRRLKA